MKDERDHEIESKSKSHALDFVVAATQILTIMRLIKGNPTEWEAFPFCCSMRQKILFTAMKNTSKRLI